MAPLGLAASLEEGFFEMMMVDSSWDIPYSSVKALIIKRNSWPWQKDFVCARRWVSTVCIEGDSTIVVTAIQKGHIDNWNLVY